MNLQDLLAEIDELTAGIAPLYEGQKAAIHEKYWEERIRLELNYTSNHIEGSTLSKEEVRLLTDESPQNLETIFAKRPRKDIYEMITHDKIVLYLLDGMYRNERITPTFIKQLHKELMYEPYNREKRRAIGNWKKEDNEIINYRNEKIDFVPHEQVADEMTKLINFLDNHLLEKNKVALFHPIEIAAKFHLDYVTIHPFYDGNGRTARLLTNVILDKYGYPPIIVGPDEKHEYSKNLAHAQAYEQNPIHFYLFIATRVWESLKLKQQYFLGNYQL